MQINMNRRTFLVSSTVGVFAIASGVWAIKAGYFNRRSRIANTIFAVFTKRLAYLNWDEAEVLIFIQDFLNDPRNKGLLKKVNKLSFSYPIYAHTDWLERTSIASKIRSFEGKIATKFLLSTNFFWNDADMTKPVKYLGYYNPYLKPCQNPFSHWW